MAAVVNDEPAGLRVPNPNVPHGLQLILRRCLEKSPQRRVQCANDLAFAFETLAELSPNDGVENVAPKRISARIWVGAAAAVGSIIVATALIAPRILKPSSPSFRQLIFGRGFISSARFTPDGESVVYGAAFGGREREVYITRLDGHSSRHMGLPPADILGISKHGEMAISLGRHNFYNWMVTGVLGLAPLSGGAPRAILDDVCDGDIAGDGRRLAIVRCATAVQTLEYPIGTVLFRTTGWISNPRISPDGKEVAFLEHPLLADDRGYVSIVTSSRGVKRLTQEWSGEDGVAWLPSGGEIWFTSSVNTEPQSLRAVNRAGRERMIFSALSDLSLHDISKNGEILLASVRFSTEVAVGHKGHSPDRRLEVADENAGQIGISDDGKVVALVYSGTAGGQDYKTLVVNDDTLEPILLGDGDPTSISPDGRWILSLLPSNPSKLILYPTETGESRTIDIAPVRMVFGGSNWTKNGLNVLFNGAEPGQPERAYLLDLKSGLSRPVTPDNTSDAVISPDGQLVVARNESSGFAVYPVAGGEPYPVIGLAKNDLPIGWDSSSTKLYVRDRGLLAKIFRVDPKMGKRELWLEISPEDHSGLLYGDITISSDGKSYAYHYRRALTNLFLANNLR